MEYQLPFRSFYHRTSKNIEKDKQEVRVFCVIRVICSLFSGEQVVSSKGRYREKTYKSHVYGALDARIVLSYQGTGAE